MVGGRNSKHSSFNRAVQARRQPGSAFKPFIFISALENGYTPADIVLDAPIVLDLPSGDVWKPRNFSERFAGEVTLRHALNKSINVAAIRILLSLGPASAISCAHKLGIKSPLQSVYSLVLGTSEVNLLELTSAYGTLGAGGVKAEPISIIRVEDRDGKTLEENFVYREEALSPQTSFMITNMMESVINEGTGRGARLMNFLEPAAGKTGTTDDYTDGLFLGYTSELVVGVWTGSDEKVSMGNRMTGAKVALPIWTHIMNGYYRDHAAPPFVEPEGIVHRVVCEQTGLLSMSHCERVRREVFIEGTEPRRYCDRDITEAIPDFNDYGGDGWGDR
jgi:penicillin-binding protein 1A